MISLALLSVFPDSVVSSHRAPPHEARRSLSGSSNLVGSVSTLAVDEPVQLGAVMLNLTLTEENGAAAAARRGLREANGMLAPAIRDDVLLLVSELVANAVRHAGAGPERPAAL